MGKTPLNLFLFFLVAASIMAFLSMPGAEARGPFRCPRMLDCNQVCQGFPNRCVDGKCICKGGYRAPPMATTSFLPNQCHSDDCKAV
ncbi:hypothetical protein ACOSP7_017418 [Xanthoceras sorbifolium]